MSDNKTDKVILPGYMVVFEWQAPRDAPPRWVTEFIVESSKEIEARIVLGRCTVGAALVGVPVLVSLLSYSGRHRARYRAPILTQWDLARPVCLYVTSQHKEEVAVSIQLVAEYLHPGEESYE